ncbi:MAG: proline--tRNA ligase, partial [Verrucomicrobia bacterium]|nr:proline--tRNA ligase [Verrucomicrobiota bacterium]
RDLRGGEKSWEWVKKGVPLRIEVGPRDIDGKTCVISRRDESSSKMTASFTDLGQQIPELLETVQQNYFAQALAMQKAYTRTDITTFDQLKAYFTPKNSDKPEIHGGFVLAKWCGDRETEELLTELKVSIRCLPLQQSGTTGTCVLTGKPATLDAIFAKSY